MVSVFLPSDALLQYVLSYLAISYLGCVVSLHTCSSKAQPLLLTLEEVAPPDLGRGVAPLSTPVPPQPSLLGHGVAPLGRTSVWSITDIMTAKEVTQSRLPSFDWTPRGTRTLYQKHPLVPICILGKCR